VAFWDDAAKRRPHSTRICVAGDAASGSDERQVTIR